VLWECPPPKKTTVAQHPELFWCSSYIYNLVRCIYFNIIKPPTPRSSKIVTWFEVFRLKMRKNFSFPIPSLFHPPPPTCPHNTLRQYNLRRSIWWDFLYAPAIFFFLHADIHLTPFLVCLLTRGSREYVVSIWLKRVGLPPAHIHSNWTSSSVSHLER
jgi:hypothetical protein